MRKYIRARAPQKSLRSQTTVLRRTSPKVKVSAEPDHRSEANHAENPDNLSDEATAETVKLRGARLPSDEATCRNSLELPTSQTACLMRQLPKLVGTTNEPDCLSDEATAETRWNYQRARLPV